MCEWHQKGSDALGLESCQTYVKLPYTFKTFFKGYNISYLAADVKLAVDAKMLMQSWTGCKAADVELKCGRKAYPILKVEWGKLALPL
jgi:hypothetical protein